MTKIIIFIIFFIFNNSFLLKAVEVDVTEGKIEPIPIALTKFNYENKNEKSRKQGMAAYLKKENIAAFVDVVLDEAAAELEEGGRCTKATQKASSTSKNKKWMKCVKNPDGEGYIRKHWGQKGVRATGDSGDTDRKKSFRARHGCADAKAGTSKKLACDDW